MRVKIQSLGGVFLGSLIVALVMMGCPSLFNFTASVTVNKTKLAFGDEETELEFVVSNGGGGTVTWEITITESDAEDWLEVKPTSGTDTETIKVTVDRSNITEEQEVAIEVKALNGQTNSATVTVSVEPPESEAAEEGEEEGEQSAQEGDRGTQEGEGSQEGEGGPEGSGCCEGEEGEQWFEGEWGEGEWGEGEWGEGEWVFYQAKAN